MDILPHSPASLLRLDHDVFNQIAEELLVQHALGSLSLTCRAVRRACAPILFRACTVCARGPVVLSVFPVSIQPYVRRLTFLDRCPDIGAMQWDGDSQAILQQVLVYTKDPLLCGAYEDPSLGDVLRKMPELYAVTFKLYPYYGYGHGLPWHLLRTILTLPQLREFTCNSHLFSPRPPVAQEYSLPITPPLTSFRYTLKDSRVPPRMYPAERDALDLVLKTFHASLEALELPTEPTPFHTLRSLPWPSLRELKLRGEFCGLDDPSIPLISAFNGMCRLHTLELALTLLPGTFPRLIWPPGLATTYPWSNLRRLVVYFPHPDDQLYSHLPSTIRTLVLRYSPHLATHRWANDLTEWTSPTVPARDILDILHKCRALQLEELTVEYHQDDEEANLLRYIATAFPTVRALKILRYRAEGVREVDVAGFALALAAHPCLHLLSVYLDLRGMSNVPHLISDSGRPHGYLGIHESRFQRVLDDAANVLAENLGPSVALIKQLRPVSHTREWAVYKVVRDERERPRARYDYFLTRGVEEPQIVWMKMPPDTPDTPESSDMEYSSDSESWPREPILPPEAYDRES